MASSQSPNHLDCTNFQSLVSKFLIISRSIIPFLSLQPITSPSFIVPLEPQNVTQMVGYNYMYLTWEPPAKSYGIIRNYTVTYKRIQTQEAVSDENFHEFKKF